MPTPSSKAQAPGNEPTKDEQEKKDSPSSQPANQPQAPGAPEDIRTMETPDTDQSVSPLTAKQAHPERSFHDSISGRPVDEQGRFTDGTPGGVTDPTHIVADDWPDRDKHSKTDRTVHNRVTDGTNRQ